MQQLGKVVCCTSVGQLTPKRDATCSMDQVDGQFNATIFVKLGNTVTEAGVDKYVLTPVYETHGPHTNVYNGEGTPNSTTECYSLMARECPPSTQTIHTGVPVFFCKSHCFSGFP